VGTTWPKARPDRRGSPGCARPRKGRLDGRRKSSAPARRNLPTPPRGGDSHGRPNPTTGWRGCFVVPRRRALPSVAQFDQRARFLVATQPKITSSLGRWQPVRREVNTAPFTGVTSARQALQVGRARRSDRSPFGPCGGVFLMAVLLVRPN
jgi:hypothetical protein